MQEEKIVNNIVSVSGGKDSTATLLLAIAQETPNLSAVFADTGNEHELTYEYVHYLEQKTGVKIQWVKADFSQEIQQKRKYVSEKWPLKGVPDEVIETVLEILHPTGNPYLDLCLWKGRFPSTKAQFCTFELKISPVFEQCFFPILDKGELIYSWQGVRRDESLNRRYLKEFDEVGGGLFNYRPILKWPALATFEAMSYMGIKPNPLYSQGCSRVGCFCINSKKGEIRNWSERWPEHIERIANWERIVSKASKRGYVTFFSTPAEDGFTDKDYFEKGNIYQAVEWSKTTRGGVHYDLFAGSTDSKECASSYGLCGEVA